jgi:hypothetical protein
MLPRPQITLARFCPEIVIPDETLCLDARVAVGMRMKGVQRQGYPSWSEKEKALLRINEEGLWKNPGGVLLSHTVTHVVPSALEGLTSVFGMGTGVTPPLSPPKTGNE